MNVIRCMKHRTVPQYNNNENGKGECGACIAEGFDQKIADLARKLAADEEVVNKLGEILDIEQASEIIPETREVIRKLSVARAVLMEIRDHPHCETGCGLVCNSGSRDGHRCCASIADRGIKEI